MKSSYVSERFAAARRRIDNLKLDWLDIEAMYTSSAAVFYTDEKLKELSGWSEEDIRILFADPRFPSADYGRRPVVEVHSLIQESIHVFSLVRKYVSRILGTYQPRFFS
ncbi:hypothetical protein [Baileyella intestinalis]|jgi:hypothetical protein|uniref:hypothetical protein n=1 Tax=Baileyella intestinalis TaxID=2606709 RepID=UPI0022E41554|nr:hypothetical protein [Baileyella intestinalis]